MDYEEGLPTKAALRQLVHRLRLLLLLRLPSVRALLGTARQLFVFFGNGEH
mgnify:CR=1 FL=1